MNPIGRTRLFLLAAFVVLAALVLLARDPTGEHRRGEADRHEARPVAQPAPARSYGRPPRGTEPPNPPYAAPDRRAAATVARRFIHAFIALQHRADSGRARPDVARTATMRLSRSLLDQPVRGTPPARPAVRRLTVHGPFDRGLKVSVSLRYPNRLRGLLELELRRREGRWRVTRIHP